MRSHGDVSFGLLPHLPWFVYALLSCAAGSRSAVSALGVDEPQHLITSAPPAALVEVVPRAERSDLVWVDGAWHWRDGRWVWLRGGWAEPLEPGTRYFAGRVLYGQDARLHFIPPGWVDAQGKRVAAPRIVIPAAMPPAARSVEGLFR